MAPTWISGEEWSRDWGWNRGNCLITRYHRILRGKWGTSLRCAN